MNKEEIAAVQFEIKMHKDALRRLGDSGLANDFELDYQAGMISGLELGLKVARRAKR